MRSCAELPAVGADGKRIEESGCGKASRTGLKYLVLADRQLSLGVVRPPWFEAEAAPVLASTSRNSARRSVRGCRATGRAPRTASDPSTPRLSSCSGARQLED